VGIELEKLKQKGYMRSPGFVEIPWKDRAFATASGKFEFLCADSIADYLEAKKASSIYSFRLLSAHSAKSLHSQHYLDSSDTMPDVFMDIEDADALGIQD
jgi:anaerobic selenocysteine-containing dehydrogenase